MHRLSLQLVINRLFSLSHHIALLRSASLLDPSFHNVRQWSQEQPIENSLQKTIETEN